MTQNQRSNLDDLESKSSTIRLWTPNRLNLFYRSRICHRKNGLDSTWHLLFLLCIIKYIHIWKIICYVRNLGGAQNNKNDILIGLGLIADQKEGFSEVKFCVIKNHAQASDFAFLYSTLLNLKVKLYDR